MNSSSISFPRSGNKATMESLLVRTNSGSATFQNPLRHASRRHSVSVSGRGVFTGCSSPKISPKTKMSLRSSRESDVTRSEARSVGKIGAYYEEMLKSNPTSALLLRNYGKYLHEVEKDVVKAEALYGRAILAEPGDGEVLSLYGNLIWETQRDEARAKSYFDQALHASPQDCMVLGSYAHFMWEQEDEEDEEMGRGAEVV